MLIPKPLLWIPFLRVLASVNPLLPTSITVIDNFKSLPLYSFIYISNQFSSVTQSCPTLLLHELQLSRPPCLSPTPRVHPNPCPSSQWCHSASSSSVISFSSCPQFFPASGSFPMNQLFTSSGQIIGVSASISVLPMNIQDWSPLGWTRWISL